eukprot:1157681-Pelagomonas_calceolata.AAC.3
MHSCKSDNPDCEEGEDDPKLAEFLALMAPRSRAKLWSNDDLLPEQTLQDLQVGMICHRLVGLLQARALQDLQVWNLDIPLQPYNEGPVLCVLVQCA